MGVDTSDREAVHRTLNTNDEDPIYEIIQVISELEGERIEKLPSVHDELDGIVDHLFSNPPKPEAQAVLEFTYTGYRIKIHQDGEATFLKVA